MADSRTRPSPLITRALAVTILIVAVADVATVWDRHSKAKPVTVRQAVQQYRASTHHSATAAPTRTPTPTHTQSLAQSPPSSPPQPTTPATPADTVMPTQGDPVSAPASATPTHSSGTGHPSSRPTAQPAPTLSEPGVYTYATTGSEQTSVPGTERSFPATTPVTVAAKGCGESVTWQPFDQHSETQVLCLTHGGVRLASYQTKISFFGTGSNEDFKCPANALVYPQGFRPGQTSSFTCVSSDSQLTQQLTAVGFATLHAGGVAVRTLHIHVTATLSGSESGSSSQDFWVATSNSLVIRNKGRVDATQDGVNYKEKFNLRLDSVRPQR
jgi:hypothetical protein